MDVKHRKETSVGWLRIMLTTLILIFAVPFSTMFADEPEMESRAVGETVDSAPNVTIIRANGDVATPMGAGEWDYLGVSQRFPHKTRIITFTLAAAISSFKL